MDLQILFKLKLKKLTQIGREVSLRISIKLILKKVPPYQLKTTITIKYNPTVDYLGAFKFSMQATGRRINPIACGGREGGGASWPAPSAWQPEPARTLSPRVSKISDFSFMPFVSGKLICQGDCCSHFSNKRS